MRRGLVLSLLLLPGALMAQQPAPVGPANPNAGRPGPTVDVSRLTTALSAERRRAFQVGMQLTPAQDSIFWPIFEKFEAERRVISERMARSVQHYAQNHQAYTDEQAGQVAKATSESEEQLIQIRGKAAEELRKKLGGKVGLRFFLIDDYLTIAVRLDVLDDLPVLANMGQ
jgi:hypothetical protein